MDTVRFGIIGVGGMGSGHARNMPFIDEVELTAVCDISPQALGVATEAFGVPGFATHTELLDSGLVDAVIVATPHYFHPPIAIDAMERGIHVISEKPMAVTVSGAEAMIEAARRTGVVFSVMFQQRTLPVSQAAKRLVDEGRLGELYRTLLIDSHFRSQAYYNSAGWRATWKGEGGGVLLNQAPHGMDLFTWLGGMPSRVIAKVATRQHTIEVEDEATALIEYPERRHRLPAGERQRVPHRHAHRAVRRAGQGGDRRRRPALLGSHARRAGRLRCRRGHVGASRC